MSFQSFYSFVLSFLFITSSLLAAPQSPIVTLENRILNGGQVTIPVTAVLESFLAASHPEDSASMLLEQLDGKLKPVNPVRKALASKWVNNAVGHIFHQELRSFLEIVVNACDASVTADKAVGKFGMGFFSILKLLELEETSGTKVEVDTTYRNGKQLVRYSITFTKSPADGQIIVTFAGKQVPKNASTSTTVSIIPNKGTFSATTLFSLVKYVTHLRCYPHAPIELTLNYGKERGREVINQKYVTSSNNPITVLLDPQQLNVSDRGTGISLQAAFTQLLIPSNSNKGVVQPLLQQTNCSLPQVPMLVPQTNITADAHSHFFIAINGVIVIDKKLPSPFFFYEGSVKRNFDLFINMPQGTQLTLARNELLIKPDGSSTEEKSLQQIITNTIQSHMQDDWCDSYLLQALYEGLQVWEKESASSHLSGRFTTFVQQELDRLLLESKNCFASPPWINAHFLKTLLPKAQVRVISINPELVYHNYEPFEEFLIKEYMQQTTQKIAHREIKHKGATGELIQGMHIIFMPDSLVSFPTKLGLRKCLFVPESFITKTSSQTALINKLMTALPTQKLQSAADIKLLVERSMVASEDPLWKKDQARLGIAKDAFDKFCAKDITWVQTITRPLNAVAPTLKQYLQNCICGFNVFQLLSKESKILSEQTKQRIDYLKQAHLGRCNIYFAINAADIPFIYGESKPELTLWNNGICTGWGAVMVWLLEKFEQDELGKTVIPKLLQFQKLDFVRKTDIFMRNKTIGERNLYVPDMCFGTPIALLASVTQGKKSSAQVIRLLATVVQHVRSLEELSFVLLALNTMSPYSLEQLCSARGLLATRLTLKHYVQEKIEHARLEKFYEATWKIDFTDLKAIEKMTAQHEPSCFALQNVLKSLVGQETELPEVSSAFPQALKNFTCNAQPVLLSQLLTAHCQGVGLLEHLNNNRIEELRSLVKGMPSAKLGKITQNIEAGSEKDPIEGTIIESLQNSVDATKSLYHECPSLFNKNNFQARAHVDIQLGWMRNSADSSSVVLTLADYAGFPGLKELLTEFILPDLSNKSLMQGLVGQMGNGSFKIYQNAEVVNILTRSIKDNRKCFWLAIRPIRSGDTKNVQDLELVWHDVSDHIASQAPDFFGTAVTIKFQEAEHEHTQMTLASTLDFLRNGVGSCNAEINNVLSFTVSLNAGQQLNQPDKNIVLYEHVVDGKVVCRLFKNHYSFRQSYITTAGIPFRSLSSVAQEMNLLPENFCKELEQGYIVDLAPGFYEPVQSRAHLQMSEQNIQLLSRILFELFFIDGLYKAFAEIKSSYKRYSFLSRHFTHFLSDRSIQQLHLDQNDHDRFQKTFKDWVTSGSSKKELSSEAFFDFYKPLSFADNSFSSFYDLIDIVEKKMTKIHETFHKELITRYADKHGATMKKFIDTQSVASKPDKILSAIKDHFNQFLYDNDQQFDQALYSTSRQIVTKMLDEVKIGATGMSKELSYQFFEQIIKNWISRKMKKSNFSVDRSYATELLLEHETVTALKNMIKEDELSALINKPAFVRKDPEDQAKMIHIPEEQVNLLNKAWTLFCQEFFVAIGKPEPKITCVLSPMLSENVAGCYLHSRKTILLNQSFIKAEEQIKLFQALALYNPNTMSLAPIFESSAFKALYAPIIGKAPTLLHELEHARRAEQIDSNEKIISGCGTHTQGYDAQGHFVHFDACANSWGAYAIQHEVIEKWAHKLKALLKK